MKKNKVIKLVFLSILVGMTTEISGQSRAADGFSSPCQLTVYSPQVADMIRYDHISANLNLGRIDLTIPLVAWQDKDFDIPISLSYNSAGFRPRDSDNYVGRDWMLNAGGVVYRHVNGIPDDIKGGMEPLAAEVGDEFYVDGFLSVLNKRYFNLERMNNDIRENPYKYSYRRSWATSLSTLPELDGEIESSADVFYFSFGKHSGKFMINYDGSISVSGNNGGKYEVDLNGMKMFESRKAQDTYIRIKTDDGYVYTFGGNGYSSLEYTAHSWRSYFENNSNNEKNPRNEITAYHLTEIKAPNGRKLTITYRDIDKIYHEDPWKLAAFHTATHTIGVKEKKTLALQYCLSGKVVRQMYCCAPSNIYLNNGTIKPLQELYTLTKTALIDCISTDMATIQFHYSNRDKDVNYIEQDFEALKFPYHCGAKLDKIEMRSMDCVRTAQFSYVYQLGNRMFLQQIKTSDKGAYSFKYNTYAPVDTPTPMTSNIDHWGFWRGRKLNNGIIPAMRSKKPYESDYVITSDDRNSTGEDYDFTLLREVVYPTGGKSVFEYEANRYSRIPTQNSSSSYRIALKFPDGKQDDIAGGARIYCIKQCDSKDDVLKKSIFTYGGTLLMGEIMYMPYYKYIGTLVKSNSQYAFDSFSFDSEGVTRFYYPLVHIRYPEVTEHFVVPSAKDLSLPHSYKTTCFRGYINKFNTFYYNEFIFPTYPFRDGPYSPETYFPNTNYEDYNKNLLGYPVLDGSLEYGKIESEKYYNSEKKLVRQTDYKYSYKNLDKYALRIYAPVTHFGLRTSLYTHVVKEPFFGYSLDKKEVHFYTKTGDERDSKKDIVHYSYDKDGYLIQEISLKSFADSLVTEYMYDHLCTNGGFQIMPSKKTVSIGKSDGKVLLSRERWHYNYQLNSSKNASWYVLSADSVCDANNNPIFEYRVLSTDVYGNPIETVQNGGAHTIYLWGRYGQLLIARIENSTYDKVREALGAIPESISEEYSIPPSILLLREKLPQAQVYTYTYRFGVGLSSETSPNGKTVYYDYDTRGRLVQVWRKDSGGKKEILQLNDYHIINE